jgi:hypothetical protein
MNLPYIGITDFTSFSQVERMLSVFSKHRELSSIHRLHIGVMMSYKTLNDLPTKWADVFPPKEKIAEIFQSDNDDTMNCLHYADYDHNPELWRQLLRAIEFGGMGIDALQLDMPWPDPGDVANGIHTSNKNLEVILQVGGVALKEIDNDPQKLLDRLWDYDGIINHVLLDKSMGSGLGMDAEGLLPFVEAIDKEFPCLGISVAGGLGPKTMDLVKPIVQKFLHVSIDAQGQLRPSGNALDPIDWGMAEDYLIKAMNLFDGTIRSK